jgi:hypothetical protein
MNSQSKPGTKIGAVEMAFLDKALSMESGYVLNFSNRTFTNFFASEVGVDIDDAIYGGGSKASRLRRFLQVSEPPLVARALRKLWDFWETTCAEEKWEIKIPNARERLLQIVGRLEGDAGVAKTDAIERFASDETLEELVAAIERDILAKSPHVALDRLHTYCMKKFAHLLRSKGEQPSDGETLNSRAARYFNPLRRSGRIRPISEKIMKSTVETFELFNKIRNDESLAHDNVLVERAEARFIFEAIGNMLRFVKAIEGTDSGI